MQIIVFESKENSLFLPLFLYSVVTSRFEGNLCFKCVIISSTWFKKYIFDGDFHIPAIISIILSIMKQLLYSGISKRNDIRFSVFFWGNIYVGNTGKNKLSLFIFEKHLKRNHSTWVVYIIVCWNVSTLQHSLCSAKFWGVSNQQLWSENENLIMRDLNPLLPPIKNISHLSNPPGMPLKIYPNIESKNKIWKATWNLQHAKGTRGEEKFAQGKRYRD